MNLFNQSFSLPVRLLSAALAAVFLLIQPLPASEPVAVQPAGSVRQIVERLSSDEFAGRRVGTPEGDLATDFLEQQMLELGLQPAPGMFSLRQQFEVTRGIKVVGNPQISFSGKAVGPADYAVAPFSGSGAAQDAPLLFAGYGIVAKELGWDDYAGLQTTGAVAVIVRGEPQLADKGSRFSGDQPSTFADLRRKASTARDLGLKALIVVGNPLDPAQAEDALPEQHPTYSSANFDIPVIFVRRAVVEPLVAAGGVSLTDLLAAADRYNQPVSRVLQGQGASVLLEVTRDTVSAWNLIGVLPGIDPGIAHDYLVIGAHYDHLGSGGPESLATPQWGATHYGADDNASGVAAVLELTSMLAKQPHARSVMVVLFAAEEIGTVGSAYLVDHLPVHQDSVYAMLNFDMVGRLRDGALTVGGAGTAAEFAALLAEANAAHPKLKVSPSASGFGASDHLSFVKHRHPVLFFFTGVHDDYHRPSDTAEKINYEGIDQIVDYALGISKELLSRQGVLTFVEVAADETQQRSRGQLKVTMGTVPSYTDTGVKGMAVETVRPGGPAAQAGILGGDVIVRIGEKKVENIHDFMFALEGYESGYVVEVAVTRAGEELVFQVTLAARNVEQ